MWIGGLYLLQNLGFLLPAGRTIDWSIIWPAALIILGVAIKHNKHSMMCGMGGKCGMCGVGDSHKCEGADCGTCKAK